MRALYRAWAAVLLCMLPLSKASAQDGAKQSKHYLVPAEYLWTLEEKGRKVHCYRETYEGVENFGYKLTWRVIGSGCDPYGKRQGKGANVPPKGGGGDGVGALMRSCRNSPVTASIRRHNIFYHLVASLFSGIEMSYCTGFPY